MREAINILPEGSLKRDIFEIRLDELEHGWHPAFKERMLKNGCLRAVMPWA
ncbi:hypothetical protein ACFLV7_05485 [Chloroflexota bacterium]